MTSNPTLLEKCFLKTEKHVRELFSEEMDGTVCIAYLRKICPTI
jgi:hypothetical protein